MNANEDKITPALLFTFMMLIGNYMLLNLFLAILLKFISDNQGGEEEIEVLVV